MYVSGRLTQVQTHHIPPRYVAHYDHARVHMFMTVFALVLWCMNSWLPVSEAYVVIAYFNSSGSGIIIAFVCAVVIMMVILFGVRLHPCW